MRKDKAVPFISYPLVHSICRSETGESVMKKSELQVVPMSENPTRLSQYYRGRVPVREIAEEYLQVNAAQYNYRTKAIRIGDDELTVRAFMNRMLLDINYSFPVVDKSLAEMAIEEWLDKEKIKILQDHKTKLAFNQKSNLNDLKQFIEILTGESSDINVAVIAHFIWQVKRKLFNLPVDHHMMPVIVGTQGVGKSVAVQKLLSPIADLSDSPPDIPTITDERYYSYLSDYLILLFDEMSRAEKADIDALKGIITRETVTQRIMRSNMQNTLPNRATFIGTANYGVGELINDPTGVRRFWEIKCAKKIDWSVINGIDYLAIWKSVDEQSRSPIIPHLDEVHRIQNEELRNKDAVEQWLEESDFEKVDEKTPESEWIEFSKIFESFQLFCSASGISRVPTKHMFGRRLRAMGFTPNSSHKVRRFNLKRVEKEVTEAPDQFPL